MLMSVAHLSRFTFCYDVNRTEKADKYAPVKSEITTIFMEHKSRYSYRRITAEPRNRSFQWNLKVISKLMKEFGLVYRA